jgi:hypothetical protein
MRIILVTVPLAVLAVSISVAQTGTRPPAQEQANVTIADSDPPPPSLEELSGQCAVVARVRIHTAASRRLGSTVITTHTGSILELLKGEGLKTGDTIGVSVPIGRVESPGRPAEVGEAAGMKEFTPGEEVLVFLRPWTAAHGYSIAYGPAGYYELNLDSVALPDGARQWAPFGGRRSVPTSEFLSEVRARIK